MRDLFEKRSPHPQKLLNYIIFQKAVLSYYSRTLQYACAGFRAQGLGDEIPNRVWDEVPTYNTPAWRSEERHAFSAPRWRMMLVQCRSHVGKRSGAPFSGTQQVDVRLLLYVIPCPIGFTLEIAALRQSRGHGKLTYSYCFTLYRVQGAEPPYYSSDSDFSSSSSFSEGVIVVFTIDAPSASLITITPAAVLE